MKLYRFTTDKPIPILFLSAHVTTDVIAQCHEAGAAEFVAKPVRATVLLDAVERHLSTRTTEFQSSAQHPRLEERPVLTVVETPVVDPGVLADLGRLSADPTFVERLVRGFHSDAERLVEAISAALAARRYEEVKDAAHALKGGAGSVGATQLVALALRFEKATHDMLRLKASAWTEELARAADAVFTALETHLEERRKRQSSSS
jgi:two-component system sensor histidine kinase RpfC